jgi:hypothetical protein
MQFDQPAPDKLKAAVDRLRTGETPRAVAAVLGVPVRIVSELRRLIEKRSRPSSEDLRPLLAKVGDEHGFTVAVKFSFAFPEVALRKSYNPDCVWFPGTPIESNTVMICEIDDGISPKHRAGGVALANLVALRLSKRLLFFAVAPPEQERVAVATIDVHRKYLGDKWALEPVVIASFDPLAIRDRIRAALENRWIPEP